MLYPPGFYEKVNQLCDQLNGTDLETSKEEQLISELLLVLNQREVLRAD